jgi:sigma-B regulation protein RsbU (phosphoserine phosphatase)
VQKALLPQILPQLPGWEIAAFSRPASIVGGDYFDFGTFANGHQALVIADVMGKGMPASMLMASLQASLRIIIPESTSPCDVLDRVNQVFCHNIHLTKFVTIVVAELDPRTGIIRYANAGHNPPIVLRGPDGPGGPQTELLMPTSTAIGLLEKATFEAREIRLGEGDTLVFYTDGVIDAGMHSGDAFGEDRLRSFVERNNGLHAKPLMQGLQNSGNYQQCPLVDDTTIMVIKRTASR